MRDASHPPGAWNHLRLAAQGQDYRVVLNGIEVTHFVGDRRTDGFVGLQNHDDASRVRFRDVRLTPL